MADPERFWSDHDHWQPPIGKWEWANEPGGLEYLAALLREACGLEPIRERRQLEREWSGRTMTGAEIAETVGEIAAMFAVYSIPAMLTSGTPANRGRTTRRMPSHLVTAMTSSNSSGH